MRAHYLFLFNDTAPTEIYTLSLHDALPISYGFDRGHARIMSTATTGDQPSLRAYLDTYLTPRSEEHTSELQSRRDLVCRLLLEKKNRFNECRHIYRIYAATYHTKDT